MKNVEIEKGVLRAPVQSITKYPWHRMEVGDSIPFKNRSSAMTSCRKAVERCAPKVFEAGLDYDGNAHVWRTE